MTINEQEFKQAAKILKKEVEKLGLDNFAHASSLNLLARALGYRDYNTAAPIIKSSTESSSEKMTELEEVLLKLKQRLLDFIKDDATKNSAKEIVDMSISASLIYENISGELSKNALVAMSSIEGSINILVDFGLNTSKRDLGDEKKFFAYIKKDLPQIFKEMLNFADEIDEWEKKGS